MEQAQIRHTGTVVKAENGRATVRFLRSSACKSCGACLAAGDSEMEVVVEDSLGVHAGDLVTVELSKRSMLSAAALCYLLPLAGLLIGVIGGSLLGEWYALGFGVGLCALMFLVLHFVDRKAKTSRRFEPKLVSKAEKEK